MDLKLDENHDLAYAAGTLDTVENVTGDAAEVRQSLLIAFKTGLGEWPYDTTEGVAYRTTVRTRDPDFGAISADYRRVAARRDHVTAVPNVEHTHDPESRELESTVDVETEFGPESVTT